MSIENVVVHRCDSQYWLSIRVVVNRFNVGVSVDSSGNTAQSARGKSV